MWGWDREFYPEDHRLVSRGLPSDDNDQEGPVFLSHPHTNYGFFFLLTTNISFYIEKTWKRLSENLKYAEMQPDDVILTLQWRHGSTCGRRAAVRFFIFPTDWYGYVRKQRISRSGVREKCQLLEAGTEPALLNLKPVTFTVSLIKPASTAWQFQIPTLSPA